MAIKRANEPSAGLSSAITTKLKGYWQTAANDSLYRNSIYLMASTFVVAFFGFFYWVLAAHFYSTKNVGLAASLVAISNVVMILTMLGFDNSFIRYLPKSKSANAQLDTGFTVSALAALIVSFLYLIGIALFVPKLNFLDSSLAWMGFFTVFMVANMLNFLTNYPFVAYRITHIVLIINAGAGMFRLLLLFALVDLGLTGLLLAHVLAVLGSLLLTFYYMKRKMGYSPRLRIDWTELRRMAAYAGHSYLSIVFLTLPAYILPTIVVSRLGVSKIAYYYIVIVIIAALNVIPLATSQSLFAEGVWSSVTLRSHLAKAMRIIFLLTIPAILVLTLGGRLILTIFGSSYASAGYGLLVLLAIAGIPKIFSYVFSTLLRITHQVFIVAIIYGLYAIIVLAGSYIGVRRGDGLMAIGWATLIAEFITALLFTIVYVRMKKHALLN